MKKGLILLLSTLCLYSSSLCFGWEVPERFKDYKTKGIKYHLEDREINGYWYKIMGYNLDKDLYFEVLEFYEEIQEHPSYYFFDENNNDVFDDPKELIIDNEIDGLNGNEIRNIKPYELKEPDSEIG